MEQPPQLDFPFEVWSSGLETWEPAGLSFNELMINMDDQHVKNVAGKSYLMWHCSATNRWFRQELEFVAHQPSQETST